MAPDLFSFNVVLWLKPVAKGRPLVTSRGTFTPERTRQAEHDVRNTVVEALRKSGRWELLPISGPVSVEITFNLQRPYRSLRKYPTTRPDIDNMTKLVLDALNNLIWLDDGQVVDVYVHKRYDGQPSIELKIVQLMKGTENEKSGGLTEAEKARIRIARRKDPFREESADRKGNSLRHSPKSHARRTP